MTINEDFKNAYDAAGEFYQTVVDAPTFVDTVGGTVAAAFVNAAGGTVAADS